MNEPRFPAASAAAPQPMVRTALDDGKGEGSTSAKPTTIAFLGIVTWQHIAHVYTLDWRTQHPQSMWRFAQPNQHATQDVTQSGT